MTVASVVGSDRGGGAFEADAGAGGNGGGGAGRERDGDADSRAGGIGHVEIGAESLAVTSLESEWGEGSTSRQLLMTVGYDDKRACIFHLLIFFPPVGPIPGTPTMDGYMVTEVSTDRSSGNDDLGCGGYVPNGKWSGSVELRLDRAPFVRALRADFAANGTAPAVAVRISVD